MKVEVSTTQPCGRPFGCGVDKLPPKAAASPALGGSHRGDKQFSPSAESVGAARQFVASSLSDWPRAREIDIVVLLTSEVLTNVVLHAGPHRPGSQMVVTLCRETDLVRVEVADRGLITRRSGHRLRRDTGWLGKGSLVRGARLTSYGTLRNNPALEMFEFVGASEVLMRCSQS